MNDADSLQQKLEAEEKARAETEAALEKAKWDRDILHDRLLAIAKLVSEQRKDAGLWIGAQGDVLYRAHRALRVLHEVVEGAECG